MGWEELLGEIAVRGWSITFAAAYMVDVLMGQSVELYDFDPDGTKPVSSRLLRGEDANDDGKRFAAALELCRELDPDFGL